MKILSAIRTALIALVPFIGSSPVSHADSGFVTLTIYKAGWIIGGSGGSGTLYFHGRYYPLSAWLAGDEPMNGTSAISAVRMADKIFMMRPPGLATELVGRRRTNHTLKS